MFDVEKVVQYSRKYVTASHAAQHRGGLQVRKGKGYNRDALHTQCQAKHLTCNNKQEQNKTGFQSKADHL